MSKLRKKPDRARLKTDKQLKSMENKIGRVYAEHPALLASEREYAAYMKSVQDQTEADYKKYIAETDQERKAELKRIYTDKVDTLTRKSETYRKIVNKFVSAMSQANQAALDVVNAGMRQVYVENYNEVAEDCRKAGIKVNG